MPRRSFAVIFLSLLAMVCLTEAVTFVLFHLSLKREATAPEALSRLAGELRSLADDALRQRLDRIAHDLDGTVWLVDASGRVVARAGEDAEREGHGGREHGRRDHETKGPSRPISLPVVLADDANAAILFFQGGHDPFERESAFLVGLAALGAAMTLLAILLARRVTAPLAAVRRAAVRLADGDLAARVPSLGDNEFGDLGRSFNAMAESLERTIRGGRELTANVSHELRSPLARLRLLKELLAGDAPAAETPEALQAEMEREIASMDRLIERLLQLSKMDLAESVGRETLDLSEILGAALENSSRERQAKRLGLTAEIQEECLFYGRRDWLLWMTDNMVGNAVKHAPEGATLTVSLSRAPGALILEAANPTAADPGEDLERLFEPFRRGKAAASGHGLGLAIARKAAALHGGSLAARLENGVFILTARLPL